MLFELCLCIPILTLGSFVFGLFIGISIGNTKTERQFREWLLKYGTDKEYYQYVQSGQGRNKNNA